MKKETYDLLRKFQTILYAFTAAWGVLCSAIDVGAVGVWVVAITGAAGTFISTLLADDSKKYFSDKDIVERKE